MDPQLPPFERATPGLGFLRALAESILGGVLTALAFASSLEGFNPEILTRPAVTPIALMGGVAGGIIVSPAVFFLLRHVRFAFRIVVGVATVLGTIAVTLSSPRLGLFSGFILLFLLSVIAFLISHHSRVPSADISTIDRNA